MTVLGQVGPGSTPEYQSSPRTYSAGQPVDPLHDANGRYRVTGDATAPLPVTAVETTVSTATVSSLASSNVSAQLLASTAARRGLIVQNTDANDLYLKYGTTAATTDFTVKIPSGGYWEMPKPVYTGRIDVIWAADGSGSAYYTEL